MPLRRWMFAALCLALGVVCLRLGFWQLARLEERRAHNRLVQARQSMPPLRLDRSISQADVPFRRVLARGRFDPAYQIVLKNRTFDDRSGLHLVTPLRLEGSEMGLLVDRGWIPSESGAIGDLGAFAVEGIIEVQGTVLPTQTEPRWGFLADRPTSLQEPLEVWRVLSVPGIQSQTPYPLLPYFLAQSEAVASPQAPLPDVEIDLSEGPHLGYALQWFAFSGIALLGGGTWLLRSGRKRREKGPG